MGIVRDSRIVARIGVGRDEWLVSDEDCTSEEDMPSIDSVFWNATRMSSSTTSSAMRTSTGLTMGTLDRTE